MGKAGKKTVIGIVGGVCSGKSTAARELAKFGCAVIDADEIAHKLLDQKDIRERIVRVFGMDILDSAGRIDRGQLANEVFSDPVKLKKLTDILHSPVMAEVEQLIDRYGKDKMSKAIVLDVPLLVEIGWEKRCDRIIFVDCKPPVRLERAQKTGFFDADQLKSRENLQISLDKKKHIADNIVDNNSDLSGLSRQIADIFSSIFEKE
ncbi:MAG: dephospho-CoA kinase [Sedimentisphaerales bacterium]|nr:dephospho-CoA kinase [Sedimentisphaerales bacterium]